MFVASFFEDFRVWKITSKWDAAAINIIIRDTFRRRSFNEHGNIYHQQAKELQGFQ